MTDDDAKATRDHQQAYDLVRARNHLDAAAELVRRHDGENMRLSEADVSIRRAREDTNVALYAADALALGTPLAAEFPDGTDAPETPTPRQVRYLARLAETPEQRRARLDATYERMGIGPARSCQATRLDGQPCQGWALRFTARSVCAKHASQEERDQALAERDAWLNGQAVGDMGEKGASA